MVPAFSTLRYFPLAEVRDPSVVRVVWMLLGCTTGSALAWYAWTIGLMHASVPLAGQAGLLLLGLWLAYLCWQHVGSRFTLTMAHLLAAAAYASMPTYGHTPWVWIAAFGMGLPAAVWFLVPLRGFERWFSESTSWVARKMVWSTAIFAVAFAWWLRSPSIAWMWYAWSIGGALLAVVFAGWTLPWSAVERVEQQSMAPWWVEVSFWKRLLVASIFVGGSLGWLLQSTSHFVPLHWWVFAPSVMLVSAWLWPLKVTRDRAIVQSIVGSIALWAVVFFGADMGVWSGMAWALVLVLFLQWGRLFMGWTNTAFKARSEQAWVSLGAACLGTVAVSGVLPLLAPWVPSAWLSMGAQPLLVGVWWVACVGALVWYVMPDMQSVTEPGEW